MVKCSGDVVVQLDQEKLSWRLLAALMFVLGPGDGWS
jgi:hypothetical protein